MWMNVCSIFPFLFFFYFFFTMVHIFIWSCRVYQTKACLKSAVNLSVSVGANTARMTFSIIFHYIYREDIQYFNYIFFTRDSCLFIISVIQRFC